MKLFGSSRKFQLKNYLKNIVCPIRSHKHTCLFDNLFRKKTTTKKRNEIVTILHEFHCCHEVFVQFLPTGYLT